MFKKNIRIKIKLIALSDLQEETFIKNINITCSYSLLDVFLEMFLFVMKYFSSKKIISIKIISLWPISRKVEK